MYDFLQPPSREHEESTIALNLLRRLADVLRARDRAFLLETLAEVGVEPAALEPGAGISIRVDQLESAQRFARNRYPDITLRLYERAALTDIGLVGYAIAASGTMDRAIEFAVQFHHATSSRYDLRLLESDEQYVVRQYPFVDHLRDRIDLAEEQLGIAKILLSTLGDQVDARLIEASFDYPAPPHERVYAATFPGPCIFDAPHTEIRFPSSWMSLPVKTADENAAAICASMCERILGSKSAAAGTGDQVKRFLVSREGGPIPKLEAAAAALNLTVSQLRKRLYAESTSYKRLVLEVRMTLARHYLETTSLSVQEVAYLLDYSQAPPFSRAFKAFHGHPPSQRDRQAGFA